MALVNDQFKWLYVFEPHTASRATQSALTHQIHGTEQLSHHHASFKEMVTENRSGDTPFSRFFGYDVICTVRNPFDVLVTGYHHENGNRLDFNDWFDRMLKAPRAQVPMHRGLWQDANTFCYYEYLADDIPYVMGRPVTLGYANNHKTKGKRRWQEYFSLEQINTLLMYWQTFLDHFGYYFEDDEICIDQGVRQRRVKPVGHGRLLESWL